MPFPYPSDPAEWQTCYTRQRAYEESLLRASLLIVPLAFGIFIPIMYIILRQGGILASGAGLSQLIITFLLLLLPLILAIIGFSILLKVAGTFLKDFYCPSSEINPTLLIWRRLFGVLPQPPFSSAMRQSPYLLVRDEKLDPPDHPAIWLGGPLLLIIFDGYALYLERGNRFSRVVGPGKDIPFLELYETVRAVVDFRPRVRNGIINAWTKDGIRIKMYVRLECRVGAAQKDETDDALLYPFDPQAVRRVVERTAAKFDRIEKKLIEPPWIETAWGQIPGVLTTYIAGHFLDELFLAERDSGPLLSPEVGNQLLRTLDERLRDFGIHALSLQITQVELPEQVKQQRLRIWGAGRESLATITTGEVKAYRIRAREEVYAEAQRDLIVTIANGLKRMEDPAHFPEPLLLSLSGILDRSLGDPLVRVYLAKESITTLEKMQELLRFQFRLTGEKHAELPG